MGIPKIIAAASMVDVLTASHMAHRVLAEATDRAEGIADLLEKIEEVVELEEEKDDIHV